jgi:hypothetical protein
LHFAWRCSRGHHKNLLRFRVILKLLLDIRRMQKNTLREASISVFPHSARLMYDYGDIRNEELTCSTLTSFTIVENWDFPILTGLTHQFYFPNLASFELRFGLLDKRGKEPQLTQLSMERLQTFISRSCTRLNSIKLTSLPILPHRF